MSMDSVVPTFRYVYTATCRAYVYAANLNNEIDNI